MQGGKGSEKGVLDKNKILEEEMPPLEPRREVSLTLTMAKQKSEKPLGL